jgi:hypothetical protein
MSNETASLIIKIDSTDAKRASAELDKLTASSKGAEQATAALGETQEQANARVRAMIQATAGQNSAYKKVEESERSLTERAKERATATEAASVTTATEARVFNEAVLAKRAALLRLDAAMAGNVATSAGMLEAETALDAAMAAGALTE